MAADQSEISINTCQPIRTRTQYCHVSINQGLVLSRFNQSEDSIPGSHLSGDQATQYTGLEEEARLERSIPDRDQI